VTPPLRKRLIVGGGIAIVASLVMTANAQSFLPVLIAMVISYPASGAFVTLAQATLMDLNPGREAHMMARWTVAGSVGNLLGPLLLAGGFAIGLSWRHGYGFCAGRPGSCCWYGYFRSKRPVVPREMGSITCHGL
jgi:FSR family fosmidomycin resistance protein-like MFS transporter